MHLRKNAYEQEAVNEILKMTLDEGEKRKIKKSQIRSVVIALVFTPIMMFILIKTIDIGFSTKHKNCLLENDWVFGDSNNPEAAFKFNSDGSFSSSVDYLGTIATINGN